MRLEVIPYRSADDAVKSNNVFNQVFTVFPAACTPGWKCISAYQTDLQEADCSWANLKEYCQYGCRDGHCFQIGEGPDLVMSAIDMYPETPRVNETIQFTAHYKNLGTVEASGFLLLASSNNCEPSQIVGPIASVKPGEEHTYTFSGIKCLKTGLQYITFYADWYDKIFEMEEFYNTLNKAFTVVR